jgi:hypothetical protein
LLFIARRSTFLAHFRPEARGDLVEDTIADISVGGMD